MVIHHAHSVVRVADQVSQRQHDCAFHPLIIPIGSASDSHNIRRFPRATVRHCLSYKLQDEEGKKDFKDVNHLT